MYNVVHKTMGEIGEEYGFDKLPDDNLALYECIMTEGATKVAQFIKLDIRSLNIKPKQPLNVMVRCYILDENCFNCDKMSEILERYG